MSKEKMYDVIVRKLGHEHKATIWFIEFAETIPDEKNEQLYNVLIALLDLVEYAEKVTEGV
jgi:hypothetical protein